jgi:hypothetical protein
MSKSGGKKGGRRQVHPALSAVGAVAVALVAWGMLKGSLDVTAGAERVVVVLIAVRVTDRFLIPLCAMLVGTKQEEEVE